MIPVVDLFAGPGGLGEGFSSLVDDAGMPVFQTVLSVECDPSAHQTLRLRSYVRKIFQEEGRLPEVYLRYMQVHDDSAFDELVRYRPDLWEKASREALCATLRKGDPSMVEEARVRLEEWGLEDAGPWVLIGGPPCQAYSIVGRSRRAHDKEGLENDVKQTLYECYLAFINELRPAAFVMENVKGLLSAQHKGHGVFDRICSDMREAGYEVRSLVKEGAAEPKDYVVEAERYGVPQMRHRVILLGIRDDFQGVPTEVLRPSASLTLRDALKGVPRIRSGFSDRGGRSRQPMSWPLYVKEAADRLLGTKEGSALADPLERVRRCRMRTETRGDAVVESECPYEEWYRGRLGDSPVLANHESRTHMASDLDRYLFCAAFAEVHGRPARITDFPDCLYPDHKNVRNVPEGEEMKFSDRFRVQLWDKPSTTITSHIAKDGHYYIHPDPEQCRSLTVREAARLQTFPDDYLFEGNRTAQYTQVGNAVPPLLAQQIGKVVARLLGKDAHGFCDTLELVSAAEDEACTGTLPS